MSSKADASSKATSSKASSSTAPAGLDEFLNKADMMNNEEEKAAKVARSKAGDNQALITLADTLNGDHKANEEAVKALSRQKNVKLESKSSEAKKPTNDLNKLKGAEFNNAFLDEQVKDHQQAISDFQKAQDQFSSDKDVSVYISETLPVLEAHMKMAQNLKSADISAPSSEKPENNKSTSSKE